MLIIAGKERAAPEERDRYVERHKELIQRARVAPGCLDCVVAADPIEPAG